MLRTFFVLSTLLINCWPAAAWDPIGDVKDPGRILRNTEREARAALDAATNAAREALVQSNAPLFEAWLNQSRNTAQSSAMPIPTAIRRSLADFYPAWVLDRARYKVGDSGVFNLANLSIQYGGASAVTLVDVIVFANAHDASTNPVLWAHELKHIEQFANWGVHDFAIRYLRNWNAVEDPAYAAQRDFQSQLSRAPAGGYFERNGIYDGITLLKDTIIVYLRDGTEKRTFINSDYNTKIGIWLVLDVNGDGCDDLVHIITGGVDKPHYAHTHLSKCDGTFIPPDKLQFNAPGVANPQGDYNTALGFWSVKYCGGRPVLAHNPMLPDGRNHFWYPQISGVQRFKLSNQCQ